MINRVERKCKPYEARRRELGMFSLDKRRLREDMLAVFQHLKGCVKGEKTQLFSLPEEDGICSDGFEHCSKADLG